MKTRKIMTGKELAQIRAGFGLTQSQFADKFGRSVSSIAQMEQGKAPISEAFEIAVRLVEKFGIEEMPK